MRAQSEQFLLASRPSYRLPEQALAPIARGCIDDPLAVSAPEGIAIVTFKCETIKGLLLQVINPDAPLLLADNGQSARRERIYTFNQYFAMIRIDEFKYIWTAEIQNGFFQRGDWGGFSGPVAVDTGGGAAVNLYTNPKEDAPAGIRHIPMSVPLASAAGWYMKELIKYPPQFKIGVLNNNPPIYDLIPKMKGAMERVQEEIREEKYPRPQ